MPDEIRSDENTVETGEQVQKDKLQQEIPPSRPLRARSSISGFLPGLILILLGILFLLSRYGILLGEWWQYFLVGLGVVFLIEAWIQYRNPTPGRLRFGRIISGLLLIVGGLLFLFDPTKWWPLFLIFIGVVLIVQFFLRRK